MASTWIDWLVGGIIAVIGIFILYRAVKEPIDLLLGLIGRGLVGIKDMIVNVAGGEGGEHVEVIRYG